MNWFMAHAPLIIAIGYGAGAAGFGFVAIMGIFRNE